jgi:acyl-CoA reductase-like NAD-dependent aldehyde dehydrogenase
VTLGAAPGQPTAAQHAASNGTHAIVVRAPASGEVLASVPELDAEQLAALAPRARAAQGGWAAAGFGGRREILDRMRRWLIANDERVVATIVSETGKAHEDAQQLELAYAVSALSYYARQAPRLLAERSFLTRTPLTIGRRAHTRYLPYGLVGVIGPWNFPLLNCFGDAIPALAAGNSVILKPSELTPLTSLLIAEGLAECGLPEGVLSVATGGAGTGEALVDAVDFVMFTGSTATGRAVAERAGRQLTGVSLELGGKDALVVLEGADLDRAANVAVYYGMINGGQTCISIERVYAHAAIHDELVAKIEQRMRALRTGPPDGPGSVDIGAITAARQLQTIEEHVADALAKGARVLLGGHQLARAGRFYEPTLLVDVDHTMSCMQEETFGPTLAVMAVSGAEQAIALVNDCRHGLGAAVFAADAEVAEALARQLDVGAVAINDAAINYFALEAPMGGMKQSGLGRRHGAEGIRKYCRSQTILVTPRWMPRREPQMYPYRRLRSALLRRLLALIYGR